MNTSDTATVRPIISKEVNSQRKAHRVDLPLFVEYNGNTYKALDWSVSGIGFRLFDTSLIKGQQIDVTLSLPMADSSMNIKMSMICRHRSDNHFGFEFVNTNDRQRRILRHYVEMAVEGRLENSDDLVAISTMPVLNSPLEEALAFSEADQNQVDKAFKSHSLKIASAAVLFVAFLAASIFYTQVYRLEAVGIATGVATQIRSEASGVVTEVFVNNGDYVAEGQPLFSVNDPVLDAKVQQAEAKLSSLRFHLSMMFGDTNQSQARSGLSEMALMAARDLKQRRGEDLARAKGLHQQRLISNKDLSYLENQLLQATISYERELAKVRQSLFSSDKTSDQYSAKTAETLAKTSALEHELSLLKQQQQNSVVVAEADGRLTNFRLGAGDQLGVNNIVASIQKNAAPSVSVQLNEEQALKLKVGMEAKVYSKMLDRYFTGYVAEIGRSAFDANVPAHVELSSPNTLVKIELKDQNIRLPENARLKVWLKQFAV